MIESDCGPDTQTQHSGRALLEEMLGAESGDFVSIITSTSTLLLYLCDGHNGSGLLGLGED